MRATYVSWWSNGAECESECEFNPDTKTVTKIKEAENADDAENADGLEDEFVRLEDGTELRSTDGVIFKY